MRYRKRVGRGMALAAVAVLVACTTSPTGRKQFIMPNFSESEMSKMGASAFTDLKQKQPLDKDPKSTPMSAASPGRS